MNRYAGTAPIPDRLSRLHELAIDLWWSWNSDARSIFRRLDYSLWRTTAHNPVRMLWLIPRAGLDAAAADPEFVRIYDSAVAALDAARAARNTWWSRTFPHLSGQSVAYFSAEFALHQSLPIYAGGLGVLAGDQCKEGGDRETRIQQEIILGIGGVRVLKALGSDPSVFHLNEGHAAFVVLQRIRDLTERGASFDEALEETRRTTVFTTHTPVPAGHDAFPFHLVEKHLAGCWGTLGPYRDRFLALGSHDSGAGAQSNMTALALRSAAKANAVSRLHGQVTRAMWGSIWPNVPEPDRPVGSVTNGLHVPTWIASDLADLFARHLGAVWLDRQDDPELWDAILAIPDHELWAVRQALRRYLFAF